MGFSRILCIMGNSIVVSMKGKQIMMIKHTNIKSMEAIVAIELKVFIGWNVNR